MDYDRFDPIQFDPHHKKLRDDALEICRELEEFILGLGSSRSTALALTKLEECHSWINKSLRHRQLVGDTKRRPKSRL